MINALKILNLGLAFLLELAMLAAFCFFGFSLQKAMWIRYLAGIGIPLLAIGLWSLFAAPSATYRLSQPYLSGFIFILFSLAALALYFLGYAKLAIVFEVLAVTSVIASLFWKQ